MKIDWGHVDELIKTDLSLMTCVNFCKKHKIRCIPRTIGQRARKLGIRPAQYRPTEEHKTKTAIGLKVVFSIEQQDFVRSNLNKISRKQIAIYLKTSIPVLNRLITDLGLIIDSEAQRRFHKENSAKNCQKAAFCFWDKFRNNQDFANAIRTNLSKNGKRLWEDDLYRLKVSSGIRKTYNETDLKQRLSVISKKRFDEDPKIREILFADRSFKNSKLNDLVATKLEGFSIVYEREFEVMNYKFDFKIGNILLEVNGDYWHSLPENMRNDRAKRTFIERYYPQFHVCTIWESEIKSVRGNQRILEILGMQEIPSTEINLSDLLFVEGIDPIKVDKFLDSFHYLGSTNRKRHVFGLTYRDVILAVAIFGPPVRQNIGPKGKTIELIRLCRHPRYYNKNMLTFFLAKCESAINKIKRYNLMVSYADKRLHTGIIYRAANWTDVGDTAPDYNYMSNDNIPMHKKTLYNRAKAIGLTEREYAEQNGLHKIKIGCKRKFIKDLS